MTFTRCTLITMCELGINESFFNEKIYCCITKYSLLGTLDHPPRCSVVLDAEGHYCLQNLKVCSNQTVGEASMPASLAAPAER